jgi:hypothetical protein
VSLSISVRSIGGYATEGGEGRNHLPPSPTAAPPLPSLPPPHSPLAVTQVRSPRLDPGLRLQTGDKFVERPVMVAKARDLHYQIERAAVATQSAPSPSAPTRPPSVLRSFLAPFRGVSTNLNPTSTATVASPLPVPRLLVAGAMILGGLAAGGVGRWVALAGAGLAASSLYTFAKAPK